MKLYYYQDSAGNFGDDLNAWLWPRLIPDLLGSDDGVLLVGIGTLLNNRIPAASTKLIFGSGAGYGAKPRIDGSWKFLCVRGPLTADALDLPPELAVTDSAALVNRLAPVVEKRHAASFMPHHASKIRAEVDGLDLSGICERSGVHYIDPSGEPSSILTEIQASKLVLGEAMHACIVADSLRVPWIPVRLYDHILSFKWWDWCRSLELEYAPVIYNRELIGGAAELGEFLYHLRLSERPCLSNPTVFASRLGRLVELMETLCECGSMQRTNHQATKRAAAEPDGKRDSTGWLRACYSGIQELSAAVPRDSLLILVDEDQWGVGQTVGGRRRIHFIEKEGGYWGPPADGASAVEELRRLHKAGATYIAFAWPAFWWLQHYDALRDYLSSRCREVLSTPRVRVFSLHRELEASS
jgi:Polysaccharide pyruvyl transferase